MEGWLKEQRDTHGRSIEFMHLDALVDWISTEPLINELRVALKDENIDVPGVHLPRAGPANTLRTQEGSTPLKSKRRSGSAKKTAAKPKKPVRRKSAAKPAVGNVMKKPSR
jgi:hypothetical protein